VTSSSRVTRWSARSSEAANPERPIPHDPSDAPSLRDHLTLIQSRSEFDDIESTLDVGIEAIIESCGPTTGTRRHDVEPACLYHSPSQPKAIESRKVASYGTGHVKRIHGD
jgi:hypothetical protein